MSRKSNRLASSAVEDEVPRMPFAKITRVYKRPKKDTTTVDKENNSNTSNKLASEDLTKKKEEVQKEEIVAKEQAAKKEEVVAKKGAKKKRDSIASKQQQKKAEIASKEDEHVTDFLKAQQEYFKSLDEFELTVVEQPPNDVLSSSPSSSIPLLPTKSSNSPFLKDLIEQQFKKQEQDRHTQRERKQPPADFSLHDAPDTFSDTASASGGEREAEGEGRDNDMFAYDDFNNLVDELDAELSYLNAPKVPPKPVLPCPVIRSIDPTESDFFPPTPAVAASTPFIHPTPFIPPTPSNISIATPTSVAYPHPHPPLPPLPPPETSPRFAYQEYKIVMGVVGSPMSFEEFMARQKR